jgi:3-oxoacyl-[acyl-carrier protein] reductase
MEFEEKRILVTGGTRGVGRSIVEEFLKAGARVAVNGASEASVDKALAQLGRSGKVVRAPGDLGTAEGCRRTVDATLDGLGGIDVLVNNAGVNRDGPLLDMSEADWDQVLNVNLKGPMLLTQLAGKAMIEGTGGQIVNIAAVTGVQARANAVNYCCSKAGLLRSPSVSCTAS